MENKFFLSVQFLLKISLPATEFDNLRIYIELHSRTIKSVHSVAIVVFHTTRYWWGLRGLSILRWDSAETGLYHNLLGYHYILV